VNVGSGCSSCLGRRAREEEKSLYRYVWLDTRGKMLILSPTDRLGFNDKRNATRENVTSLPIKGPTRFYATGLLIPVLQTFTFYISTSVRQASALARCRNTVEPHGYQIIRDSVV